MSVICCIKCINPYSFGCVSVCAQFNTGVEVDVPGTYTLITKFAGKQKKIHQTAVAGSILTFDISKLNECYLFTFTIVGPDGKAICLKNGENIHDCFQFQSQVGECVTNAAPKFEAVLCENIEYVSCGPCGKDKVLKSVEYERVTEETTEVEFVHFEKFDTIEETAENLKDLYTRDGLVEAIMKFDPEFVPRYENKTELAIIIINQTLI